jgi:membrane-associated phospholipid phosphatase
MTQPSIRPDRSKTLGALLNAIALAGFGLFCARFDQRELFLALQAVLVLVPDPVWQAFNLGGHFLGAASLFLLAVRERYGIVPLALMTFFGGTASASLKSLINAPRPAALIHDPGSLYTIGETLTEKSMPSGHALTITAVVGALCAMEAVDRQRGGPGHTLERGWMLPLAGLIAVGVVLARLASGAHWPADVLVGAGLGLAIGFGCGILGVALTERIQRLPGQAGSVRALDRAAMALVALALLLMPLPLSISQEASLALGMVLGGHMLAAQRWARDERLRQR